MSMGATLMMPVAMAVAVTMSVAVAVTMPMTVIMSMRASTIRPMIMLPMRLKNAVHVVNNAVTITAAHSKEVKIQCVAKQANK